jgi:hypothetical protein
MSLCPPLPQLLIPIFLRRHLQLWDRVFNLKIMWKIKNLALGGVDVHLGGRWSDAAIAIILDLYEAEWMHCNIGLLAARH